MIILITDLEKEKDFSSFPNQKQNTTNPSSSNVIGFTPYPLRIEPIQLLVHPLTPHPPLTPTTLNPQTFKHLHHQDIQTE